jgi:hypothetical protein
MQTIRNYKCVFGRILYDFDETDLILEINSALYCPTFEETKSTLFTVADFLVFVY